jgi:hypothetical protein
MRRKGDVFASKRDLAELAYERSSGLTEASRRQSAWSEYCCRCINTGVMVTGSMADLMAYYDMRYGRPCPRDARGA